MGDGIKVGLVDEEWRYRKPEFRWRWVRGW